MKRIIKTSLVLVSIVLLFSTHEASSIASNNTSKGPDKIWDYQCIDVMKTSRDRAREWADWGRLDEHINKQMSTIKETGANCVAIGTPYDDEFNNYREDWVKGARAHNLHVWHRGNFSSWEGWFGYPRQMTTQEHNEKTKEFIINNAHIFEDGDIFTPAPEAENGGPFAPVTNENKEEFQNFLRSQNQTSQQAFTQIGKDVKTNWLSMSGGVAKGFLDENTINDMGGIVTIDHYVTEPSEMNEYIDYFKNTYSSKVVIGEFGAPIPDLNGEMNDEEQAAFIDNLLYRMYLKSNTIDAINYWVLYDSTTALLDSDNTRKKAYEILKKYYSPSTLNITIKNAHGRKIRNARIVLDENIILKTSKNGKTQIALPNGNHQIEASSPGYKTYHESFIVENDKSINLELEREQPKIYLYLRQLLNKILQL